MTTEIRIDQSQFCPCLNRRDGLGDEGTIEPEKGCDICFGTGKRKPKLLHFKIPLFKQLIAAVYAHDIPEMTRIYFEMYPDEKPTPASPELLPTQPEKEKE